MKKIILLALIFMCATLANGQILYRISGNGLKKASYIVGTHHLVDESFVEKIPGINTAMKETKQVYGEVVMTDLMNPDTVKMMQKAMLLPDDATIKEYLDEEHFEMLDKLFTTTVGVPFTFPQIFDAMGKMRPSALETQIQALLYLKDNPGAFDPTKGIDTYFQNQALKAKKKVGGLESCDFQINLLFLSSDPKEEVPAFNCLLENIEVNIKELSLLTDAYKNQNADQIQEAMNTKYGNECDEINDMRMKNILAKRNDNWLQKMPAIMKAAPTLFVVGAGHLFDENGILELLTRAGYTVEAVK